MAEESYSFTTARTRLEEIVAQVRKKDTSLEKSLDLLEEGVRLANVCTEQIDHADWVSATASANEDDAAQDEGEGAVSADSGETADDETEVVEDVVNAEGAGGAVDEAAIVAGPIEAVEFEAVRDFVDADEAWPEDFAEDALEPADPSAEDR